MYAGGVHCASARKFHNLLAAAAAAAALFLPWALSLTTVPTASSLAIATLGARVRARSVP